MTRLLAIITMTGAMASTACSEPKTAAASTTAFAATADRVAPPASADPTTPVERTTAAENNKNRRPEFREVTIPAGTVLPLELRSSVSSDDSRIEDPVRATLRRAITVGGIQALPAGSTVTGYVTAADRSARVKGRARIAFRFTSIDPAGDAGRVGIRTNTVSRLAPATKKQDAAKIGGGAAGGAIIGGILGGGDGAAKGAAIGGAAGTGVVLATRGKEVRLGPGAVISTKLAAPVTVRVPMK